MTTEPSTRRSRMPIAVIVVLVIGIAVAVAVANGAFRGSGSGTASPEASVEGVIPADANVVAEGRAVPIKAIELQVGAPGTVAVGSSRVDLQACKLEYSIVSPK